MKKLSLFMLLFLFSIPFAFASEYLNTGYNGFSASSGQYQSGTSTTPTTRTIGSVDYPALVGDVTGNGKNEVIVFSGGTASIYNGSGLLNKRTVSTGYTYTSNPIIFDIDGDGINEIIVAEETRTVFLDPGGLNISISIINVTSTSAKIERTFLMNSSDSVTATKNYAAGEIILACRDVNECALAYARRWSGGVQNAFQAQAFNSTASSKKLLLRTESAGDEICLPQVRMMDVSDINDDGTDDYIVSYYFAEDSGSSDAQIIHVFDVSQSSATEIVEIENSDVLTFANFDGCDSALGISTKEAITGALENNDVIWTGYQISATQYKLRAYNIDGSEFNTYPAIEDGEGDLISNPFKMKVFPDEGEDDSVCVLGQDESAKEISMLCASSGTSYTACLPAVCSIFNADDPAAEFTYSYGTKAQIPQGTYNFHQVHAMSGDMNPSSTTNSLTGNGNIDELIFNYGTFKLDFSASSCTGLSRTGDCDMTLDYTNTIGTIANTTGILISADAKSVGSNQLLFQKTTTMTLIDNIFTNKAPSLTIFIDPCTSLGGVAQAWKQNTTVSVTTSIIDIEGDNVQVTAQFNQGTSSEVNETTIIEGGLGANTFTFTASSLGANKRLKIIAKDLTSLRTNTQTEIYSVQPTGIEIGDCTTTLNFDSDGNPIVAAGVSGANDTTINAPLTPNQNDNSIRNALVDINSISGMNLGLTTLWLIIMLVVAGTMFTISMERNESGTHAIGLILIIEVLLVILGVYLGFLSFSLMIILAIIALAIVGGIVKFMFMPGRA